MYSVTVVFFETDKNTVVGMEPELCAVVSELLPNARYLYGGTAVFYGNKAARRVHSHAHR